MESPNTYAQLVCVLD